MRLFGKSTVSDPDYKRAQEEKNAHAKIAMSSMERLRFEMSRPDAIIEMPKMYAAFISERDRKSSSRSNAIRRAKWRTIRARRFK